MTGAEAAEEQGEGFHPPPPRLLLREGRIQPSPSSALSVSRSPGILRPLCCAAALLSLVLAGMQLRAWLPAGRPLASTSFGAAGGAEAAGAADGREATRRAAEKQKGFRAPPSCSGKAAAMNTEEWRQCGAGERGGCAKNFTPFIIMFGGQTGTQHLGHDVFKKHPELTWVGEPHAQCFLDMLGTGAGLPSQYLAAGTKTQIINPFGGCCNGQIPPNMRFIHITRLNTIAWGLSKLHKIELVECNGGRVQLSKACNDRVYARRNISIVTLTRFVHRKDALELARNKSLQDLESQGYPMMHASYEELMADEPRLVARITRFLGVSPFTQKGHAMGKSAKKELRDSFANWPEVVAAFCGTRFQRDLGLRSGETCAR